MFKIIITQEELELFLEWHNYRSYQVTSQYIRGFHSGSADQITKLCPNPERRGILNLQSLHGISKTGQFRRRQDAEGGLCFVHFCLGLIQGIKHGGNLVVPPTIHIAP